MHSHAPSPDAARHAAAVAPLPAARWQRGETVLVVLLLPLLLAAAALGVLSRAQEALLFHPTPLPAEYRPALDGVDEVWVEVDGARLHGLLLRRPGARGLVFYLHGNAGNVADWLSDAALYRRAGYDVFVLDYRGFGKSSGSITSEAQWHADVRAAWEQVAPAYAGRLRVIAGRSIGTGPAARLAASVEADAESDLRADLLVLVSPFASLRRLVGERAPLLPARVLRYPLPVEQWVAAIRTPLLIVHSEDDQTIPMAHVERLLQVRPDAELARLRGVGHNDLQRDPAYARALARRLEVLAGGGVAPPASIRGKDRELRRVPMSAAQNGP